MAHKECGKSSHQEFSAIQARTRTLLGRQRSAAFALDDDTALGLVRSGIITTKIGITLRDTTPVVHPNGCELFPYRRLLAQKVSSEGEALLTETMGAQARNRKGILADWNGGEKSSKFEPLQGETQLFLPIELHLYTDPLKHVTHENRLDTYGRTPIEAQKENDIASEFNEETNRLLELAKENGTVQITNTIIFSGHRAPPATIQRYSATYPLENGSYLVVWQSSSLRNRFLIKNRVTIYNKKRDNSDEFTMRENDGRLGIAKTIHGVHKFNNPVPYSEAERLLIIMKSLT